MQLDPAARHRKRDVLAILVGEGDGSGLGVDVLHRNVEDAARLGRDGQETAIGSLTLLAERGEHDVHDLLIALGCAQENIVEPAGCVVVGRAGELVLETEGIEEAAQHRVVVVAEALEFSEGIGHARQRLVQVFAQHVLVGDVVGDFAHAVHVVGEAEQARLDLAAGERLESAADHAGACDLSKGADVRQARGAIAGLEEDGLIHAALHLLQAVDNAAGFLKRPGASLVDDVQLSRRGMVGHG